MVFPLGDDQVRGGHFPMFSYGFIALNVIVFLFQISMSVDAQHQFIYDWGSLPAETMKGEDLHTLFSSMFMHGGFAHILGNMLFLWVFADNIEATVGSLRFVIFYILGGLAAHAGHIYFNVDSMIPTIGASGAISAVLGAYLVMFPRSQIKTLVFLFIVKIPAFIFLGFWIGQQFLAGTAELGTAAETGSGVAWWAHIGGFVFGVLAGFVMKGLRRPEEEGDNIAPWLVP